MNIFKYKVKNHKLIKEFVLGEIEKHPIIKIKNEKIKSSIYKTDYFQSQKNPPKQILPYFEFFERNEPEFYKTLNQRYFVSSMRVSNYWYQQYVENDMHNWHIHPISNLSYVYYIELNDSSLVTEFYDIETKKTFQPDAEEGDIIVFDSHIPHRSPKILSDTRKTIISSNLEIDNDIDLERFENELS